MANNLSLKIVGLVYCVNKEDASCVNFQDNFLPEHGSATWVKYNLLVGIFLDDMNTYEHEIPAQLSTFLKTFTYIDLKLYKQQDGSYDYGNYLFSTHPTPGHVSDRNNMGQSQGTQ